MVTAAMKRTACLLALVAVCAAGLGACGSEENASPATPADTDKTATELVTRFLQDVKEKDTADLQEFLDDSWQIRRVNGDSLTKDEYIGDLPDLRSYEISKVRGTQSDNALVASYTTVMDLVVDGTPFKGEPAPYLASFVQVDGQWRMLTQANFNLPTK